MASCCDPRGCDRMFGAHFARRTARRYRKHGLDRAAARIVELVEERGLDGATVLEIGGGVGDIQVELLKRGAAHATNLELSPAYEPEAQRLLENAGLVDRVDRRILDIAVTPGEVEPADIVILHRVVCCYPDYAKLLGAFAAHARRQVVFSHPPRNALSLAVIRAQHLVFRLRRRQFRAFVHPPGAMMGELENHGLRIDRKWHGRVWHVVSAIR